MYNDVNRIFFVKVFIVEASTGLILFNELPISPDNNTFGNGSAQFDTYQEHDRLK